MNRFVLKRFRAPTAVLGALLLASILPVGVAALFPLEMGARALLKNYLSLPFFLFLALFLALGTGNFLAVMLHGCRGRRGQGAFYCLVALMMAGVAAFLVWAHVVAPLRDLPYVGQPLTARLEEVAFQYQQGSDMPGANLVGVEADGTEQRFSVGYRLYRQGSALSQKAGETPSQARLVADVSYLPYSRTLLSLDCWVEGADTEAGE